MDVHGVCMAYAWHVHSACAWRVHGMCTTLTQTTQQTIFTAAEMACPSKMYNHTVGGVCETELAPWRLLALVGAAIAVVLLLSAAARSNAAPLGSA